MSTCPCDPSTLLTVAFPGGLSLVRCLAHDVQSWLLEGQPASSVLAHERLRGVFVEQRTIGTRTTRPRPRPRRSTTARTPLRVAAGPASQPLDADARLTALLRSHGAQGSWAVA